MRALAIVALLMAGSALAQPVVLTGGMVVDGSGDTPYAGWLAMDGDRITALGKGVPPAAVLRGALLGRLSFFNRTASKKISKSKNIILNN